jgi:hypothetical protein
VNLETLKYFGVLRVFPLIPINQAETVEKDV